ncbi:MAG: CYTH and CHAD domain-containing protein [Pigmentiphaga sp.]|uniref:CYTH and CHAD domain-containing protein n=1 Tax=Pigmentiphaga sp. TaxID=1977564 RepID=UPI0029BCABA1|nr:CYTH and CHAD domain-containing protein [Pigmentiphaga sp.]MDX3907496.1 CYTH and CHAD domain-containing protein [Pigmentiphaga sp.]
MLEQELKFSVPRASRKSVAAQLASLQPPPRVRLRAMYFDTADRQLARRHAAIRLRQEGRRWVQTFKMAGADALSRIELNHPCPRRELDLTVYTGTPAEAVLASLTGELQVRYETDVWRRAVSARTRGGTVEIAYDEGVIRAGELELPVCELEFELASGRPEALFKLAARWQRQHGLVLDVRSKAERGDGLANAAARITAVPLDAQSAVREKEILRFWAPRAAAEVNLEKRASPDEALRIVTAECFDQIVRNATALAAVEVPADTILPNEELVHQLRVGMRRLRSAWRLFDGAAALPPQPLQDAVREHFAAFGRVRDRDVIERGVLPALLEAGMPALPAPPAVSMDAAGLACAPGFQGWLLAMLAWNVGVREPAPAPASAAAGTVPPAVPPIADPVKLAPFVTARLRKWHKRLTRGGEHFALLDDERRHALRKLAKRLRYGLALSQSLYRRDYVRAYRKKLSALQDILGEVNDLVVARGHYAGLIETHSQSWFALGWIAARLDELEAKAEDAFRDLGAVRTPWK